MTWILASASPRRREMLQHLGLNFSVVCADADESSEERDGGRLVELLAARKAAAVKSLLNEQGRLDDNTVILAADTVVVSPEGDILGKPHDADDARRMLRLLSSNTHRVISGICVVKGERTVTAHEVTEVTFAPLSDDVIEAYIASGEPMDKAGSYGIQGIGAKYVKEITGDYNNVVGLPVARLYQELK